MSNTSNRLAVGIVILLVCLMALSFLPVHGEQEVYDTVVRLHVLANSDTEEDQALKLRVRDAILEVTSPLVENCTTQAEAMVDAFGGSAYPEDAPPKVLLPMTAKQLPGYAGNMDTAASDLAHYQKMEFGSLVLCGTRRRAELLQEQLRDRGLSAFLCIPLTTLPKPGQILLCEGTLPFGMEYPLSKLAILTEGQLLSRSEPKRKATKKTGSTNRQKLNSFTDLTPGDLVVHENYGIGRFVAMEQIKVDNAVKDYIKIAYQGSDTLFVPATQLAKVTPSIPEQP